MESCSSQAYAPSVFPMSYQITTSMYNPTSEGRRMSESAAAAAIHVPATRSFYHPTGHSHSHTHAEMSSPPTCSGGAAAAPARRKLSKQACINCRTAKTACDESRPCKRCVRCDKGHLCVDAPAKKRGRKMKYQNNTLTVPNNASPTPSAASPGANRKRAFSSPDCSAAFPESASSSPIMSPQPSPTSPDLSVSATNHGQWLHTRPHATGDISMSEGSPSSVTHDGRRSSSSSPDLQSPPINTQQQQQKHVPLTQIPEVLKVISDEEFLALLRQISVSSQPATIVSSAAATPTTSSTTVSTTSTTSTNNVKSEMQQQQQPTSVSSTSLPAVAALVHQWQEHREQFIRLMDGLVPKRDGVKSEHSDCSCYPDGEQPPAESSSPICSLLKLLSQLNNDRQREVLGSLLGAQLFPLAPATSNNNINLNQLINSSSNNSISTTAMGVSQPSPKRVKTNATPPPASLVASTSTNDFAERKRPGEVFTDQKGLMLPPAVVTPMSTLPSSGFLTRRSSASLLFDNWVSPFDRSFSNSFPVLNINMGLERDDNMMISRQNSNSDPASLVATPTGASSQSASSMSLGGAFSMPSRPVERDVTDPLMRLGLAPSFPFTRFPSMSSISSASIRSLTDNHNSFEDPSIPRYSNLMNFSAPTNTM